MAFWCIFGVCLHFQCNFFHFHSVPQLLLIHHFTVQCSFKYNVYLMLIIWPMKMSFTQACGQWTEEAPLMHNLAFTLTCFQVSLAWSVSSNFLCLLWLLYHFQNSMQKVFSLYFKTKMFHLHLEILKNVLSYSIFFFLLGMDRVLTLIIET